MEALNDRDWARACELRHEPEPDCEAETRHDFDGAEVKLKPPNTYQEGNRVNDNETTFAIEASGGRVKTAFFEIVADSIDLQIAIVR